MNIDFSSNLFPSLFSSFLSPIFISDWKNEVFEDKKLTIKVLRLDAEHQHIGGNKLYKLYYNLLEAKKQNKTKILTFGGAYSNHLRATAFAAKELKLESIAIIRGEEHQNLNPVLTFCKQQNMQLHYISRTDYREKKNVDFIEKLKQQFGDFYLIPEGGSNALALKGTSHITKIAYDLVEKNIDYFALAIGTGGTAAGILNGMQEINNEKQKTKVLAISALKGGDFLRNDIEMLLNDFYGNNDERTERAMQNLILETNFHEGGYAKKSERLIHFITDFNQQNNFQIEPIYTGKAFFAVYNLAKDNFFEKGATIVLIHTGGIF
ncbi:1-aminocyclopropane-1-carboxylate deaminase/D-cysteine desulfhydrase [Bernardetia sp. OM2101]|uniref:1-aminocyclopropane-1-carboxylate deaminase/D-cysteine desulfhydrase n=1 Tax=Bernardetia sp. OM2101 TaxID=3344876 RepID=UPI0035D0AAD8